MEYIFFNECQTSFTFDYKDINICYPGTYKLVNKINNCRVYNYGEFLTMIVSIDKNTITFIVDGSKDKPYAWNGCSPKFSIADMLFGTSDGKIDMETRLPKTYYASMLHDCLYQYKQELNGIISRKTMDRLFLFELQKANFKSAKLYYFFVRLVGSVFFTKIYFNNLKKKLWLV